MHPVGALESAPIGRYGEMFGAVEPGHARHSKGHRGAVERLGCAAVKIGNAGLEPAISELMLAICELMPAISIEDASPRVEALAVARLTPVRASGPKSPSERVQERHRVGKSGPTIPDVGNCGMSATATRDDRLYRGRAAPPTMTVQVLRSLCPGGPLAF